MTSRPEQKAKVEFYYTSSTASLLVKKAVQSTRFLLHNKAIKYEEYDCVYDDGTNDRLSNRLSRVADHALVTNIEKFLADTSLRLSIPIHRFFVLLRFPLASGAVALSSSFFVLKRLISCLTVL